MSDVELAAAWTLHVGLPTSVLEGVLARYRESHRRYHGLRHVGRVVRHARQLAADRAVDVDAIVAAAFFHDAIYDPTRPDNEAASARLAATTLSADPQQWPPIRIERVVAMIDATAHHTADDTAHDTADALDEAILLAADLAVLAAEPAAYQAYVTGVRAEYAHVDGPGWLAGRGAVLRGLLDRDHIFSPQLDLPEWEGRARANLTAELAALGAPESHGGRHSQ